MAAAITLAGAASAPAWAQPASAPAVARAEAKKDKSIKVEKAPVATIPDAELLDYLGCYGDAADGLDPLGLADADAAPAPAPVAKDHRQ
ncbi:MAG TPA: hypothetical protein VGH81_05595 [Rudaea sp.]|jgi:hypothetical protein